MVCCSTWYTLSSELYKDKKTAWKQNLKRSDWTVLLAMLFSKALIGLKCMEMSKLTFLLIDYIFVGLLESSTLTPMLEVKFCDSVNCLCVGYVCVFVTHSPAASLSHSDIRCSSPAASVCSCAAATQKPYCCKVSKSWCSLLKLEWVLFYILDHLSSCCVVFSIDSEDYGYNTFSWHVIKLILSFRATYTSLWEQFGVKYFDQGHFDVLAAGGLRRF